jgi:hypothetical protein
LDENQRYPDYLRNPLLIDQMKKKNNKKKDFKATMAGWRRQRSDAPAALSYSSFL